MEKVPWVGPTASSVSGAKLHDFEIQAAAEPGRCAGAQSFRAVHRCDGMPVLLHKFRPAQSLLELGPFLDPPAPPDFGKPFMTRFTDLFAAAGSAYLVEPLPDCLCLSDVWRHVLLHRTHETYTFATTLARQLLEVIRELARQGRRHGGLTLENIVLASTGNFGVLAAGIKCEEGLLWLRRDPQVPVTDDRSCLAEVLYTLLDIDEELASAHSTSSLLCPDVHEGILYLADAVEQSRGRAKTG